MLLRFGVSNFLSLRDRQEVSLIASSLKDYEGGLIKCDSAPGGRVLPALVMYGANASGKTNFVEAIRYMRQSILFSHSRGEPDGEVPRISYGLDSSSAKKTSSFDADFVFDGMRYHYGFECSDKAFKTEWLYAFPKDRRQMLFERDGRRFRFGRGLKGRNKVIADLTRANSLFLSAAAQNGHDMLSKLVRFFRSIYGSTAVWVSPNSLSMRFAKRDVDKRIIDFLNKIGTGVVDYRRTETEIPREALAVRNEVFSVLRKIAKEPFDKVMKDTTDVTIEFAHQGRGGKEVFFELAKESAGTLRLFLLLERSFRALDRGAPIVIDELDASLHTQACEALLALFSSAQINPKGAQLIATSHDTNLLRSPLLRRDQIWFSEKDPEGATHVYPLTDIHTRKEDNIEKGYLQGRYGAIPFSGPLTDLIIPS